MAHGKLLPLRLRLPRSCDRCHSLKERCERRPPNSATCVRCKRLELACAAERPVKKSGRRPQRPAEAASDAEAAKGVAQALARPILATTASTLLTAAAAPPPPQQRTATLDDDDADLLQLIDSINAIQDSFFGHFVLGPTWFRSHRQALLSSLCAAHELLRDAFLACFLLWPSQTDAFQAPSAVDVSRSYGRASAAVDKLRRIQVASAADASSCLALGMLLLTFAHRLGNESYHICAHVLGSVKPVLDADAALKPPPDYSFLSCIILTEMEGCLVRTAVPTLRLPPAVVGRLAADRYLGVCASLMPLLYDLCCVNSLMERGEPSDAAERLESVESAIRSWRPALPQDFPAPFTTKEACCMLCQAHAMQTAALLILHRLRYPFGSVDSPALALSTSILMQIESIHFVCGQPVPNVCLPLFVACMEVQDGAERGRHLRHLPTALGSRPYRERLERMLNAAWQQRQHDPGMRWCGLGAVLFPPA